MAFAASLDGTSLSDKTELCDTKAYNSRSLSHSPWQEKVAFAARLQLEGYQIKASLATNGQGMPGLCSPRHESCLGHSCVSFVAFLPFTHKGMISV